MKVSMSTVGLKETGEFFTNVINNTPKEGVSLIRRISTKIKNKAKKNIRTRSKFSHTNETSNSIRTYRFGPKTYVVEVMDNAGQAIENGRQAINFQYPRIIPMKGIGFRRLTHIEPSRPMWFMRDAINSVKEEMKTELNETSKNMLKR